METENQNASLQFPLLQNSGQDGLRVDVEQNKKRVVERTEIIVEVKKQLWFAVPLIFVNLLPFCIQVISVMFVGHLGELALAGASIATSFASVTGTARGCGLQNIGAYINLVSYYLAGLPTAILLAFVLHLGGKGLWLGIICAVVVQTLSLLIVTVRTNWEQEAKKAADRVYNSITPETIS
ncbi:hypothetical protein RIF29_35128 [Crotalaria pallida]|uniref:Uncharacterized protein n=1 Tax=Crotalaria pallida TaxID=3830 RepID=A0AAN9HTN7_CROPI